MKTVAAIIVVSTVLTGCVTQNSSNKDTEFEFVYGEAKECVETISKSVIANNEPYTLSFAYYITSHSIPVINGNFTQSEKKAIPYIIVPLNDKTQVGNEWRMCMLKRNALVPNIQFPE